MPDEKGKVNGEVANEFHALVIIGRQLIRIADALESLNGAVHVYFNKDAIKIVEEKETPKVIHEDAKSTTTETVNYIDVRHVVRDGKIIQTPKAYLFLNDENLQTWVAKSSIANIYNSTDNVHIRVIFNDDKIWSIGKLKWEKEKPYVKGEAKK